MSALSYRDWDIFINERARLASGPVQGTYQIALNEWTMTAQTVEFLVNGFELRQSGPVSYSATYPVCHPDQRPLQLVIHGSFDVTQDSRRQIDGIVGYLDALSVCVDHPLTCHSVRFEDDKGMLLLAERRPFGRGLSFEIEERGAAGDKLTHDFNAVRTAVESSGPVKVAARHYLTGLGLLSLEDAMPGLIDAAFMQFYQGIEALLGTSELKAAKKQIAATGHPDTRALQITTHHVFNVRHKYFGHGDESSFHEVSDRSPAIAVALAGQVLVARRLCRTLLDSRLPSSAVLCREIFMMSHEKSVTFHGSVAELEGTMFIDYGQGSEERKRRCAVYDKDGNEGEVYEVPVAAPA